jgi:hypothetical protein
VCHGKGGQPHCRGDGGGEAAGLDPVEQSHGDLLATNGLLRVFDAADRHR